MDNSISEAGLASIKAIVVWLVEKFRSKPASIVRRLLETRDTPIFRMNQIGEKAKAGAGATSFLTRLPNGSEFMARVQLFDM